MKGLAAVILMGFVAVALAQSLAQGAPAAKKTATIKIPSDGNATVAHLVLNAKVKKGKKPKAPVKRPKLKVLKAPKGVVVAASYKRDAKNKNRWHATVAITNPMGGTPSRSATSSSQDDVVVVVVVDADTGYIVAVGVVQVLSDVTFDQTPEEEDLADEFCDPNGSSGYAGLFGMQPGVSARENVEYDCLLAKDGPTTARDFGELGLEGPVVLLMPFPGNPNEAYVDFTIFFPPGPSRTTASRSLRAAGVNGIALQFPGNTVVAQLPPQGFGGVITPGTVTWGNKNAAFVSGQTYRGNVRLSQPFTASTSIRVLITTTGGPPYSQPYPGNFVP